MQHEEMITLASQWAHAVLEWVGFGTLVGLLAKAIMPGKDPGGSVATLVMGVGGTVIGCGTLSFFMEDSRVTPISPEGFAVAVGGAFVILFFYKFLGGYWFQEDEGPLVRKRTRRSTRRAAEVVYED
jgi:uncharacterized membrane protein YeaQ/YmgE (transglycosylase-associated protein family)